MQTDLEVAKVLDGFALNAEALQIVPVSIGNIHQTYRVSFKTDSDLLLQLINQRVFSDVPALMRNLAAISEHSKNWLAQGKFRVLTQVLEYVSTKSGQNYLQHSNGRCYRLAKFIPNSQSFNQLRDDSQAFSAAQALADYERCLNALPQHHICESIAGFQDIPMRISALENCAAKDAHKRLGSARAVFDFALQHQDKSLLISQALKQKKIKLRVVHGDLKLNNLLFDAVSSAPICVVDLDTCMPGTLAYDFGDFIRSCIVPEAEDQLPAPASKIDLPRFAALASGFLQPLADLLDEQEIELMAQTPALLALTLGVRFLTDYLDGDRYFTVQDPQHNLRRAQSQFELFKLLSAQQNNFNKLLFKHKNLIKSRP